VIFLSREWFEAARSAAAPVILSRTSSCRIQCATEKLVWHLVIEYGRVLAWDQGELDAAEVTLCWAGPDIWRIATGNLDGNEATLRTTATVQLEEGVYTGAPAPMDLLCRPELARAPRRPDATLVVHHHLVAGPLGDLDYVVDIVDGRLVAERLGPPAMRDILIHIDYRKLALVRTGQCTILEAIEGGRVEGDVGPLTALAAIYESPEVEAAFRATGSHSLALATLGELAAVPGFRRRMRDLMAKTSPDLGP
jgi:hypothetical protein